MKAIGDTGHTTDHNTIVTDLTYTKTQLNAWPAGASNFALIPPGGGDDAVTINAALAAGQPVFLVPGMTYNIATPILPQNQSFITGWQWNMASQDDNYSGGSGEPTGAVLQALPGFTGPAMIYMPNDTGSQFYGVDISGISLIEFGITSTMHGIYAYGAWGACFLRGLEIQKMHNDCLRLDVSNITGFITDDWQITDCKFSGARNGYGVNIANNIADSWFDNCEASQCALDGWLVGYVNNTRFSNCKGENNGGAGWHFSGGAGNPCMLSNCNSQYNNQDGFIWDSSSKGTYILTGCRSSNDNQSFGNTYAGFRSVGSAAQIIGTGCYAEDSPYGAAQGSSATGSMAFTGSYLSGSIAPVHDDGTNSIVLANTSPSAGGQVAITRDQVSNLYTSAGSSTAAITFGTNPLPGTTVIVAIANVSGSPVLTDNGTTPTTFTQDASNTVNTNNIHIYRADDITMPASGGYQINVTSGGNTFAAQAISYIGVKPGSPATTNNSNASSGTSVTTGSVTGNGLLFAGFSDNDASSHTVTLTNASFTSQGTSNGSAGHGGFGCADWVDPSPVSTAACTWTIGASAQWEGALACYLPVNVPDTIGAINAAVLYGADPTGVKDSTTAINNALNATLYTGAPVYLPTGTYKLAGTLNMTNGQSLIGDGSQAVTINYTGSTIAIKYTITGSFTGSQRAGRITGFYLNGYSGGATTVGIQFGELQGLLMDDVFLAGFNTAGIHFLNTGDYAEEHTIRATIVGCGTTSSSTTGCVVFDSSSWDYSNFDFLLIPNAGAHGVLLINDAQLQGCELRIRGNFLGATPNTGAVIAIDPANTGTDNYIRNSLLDVAAETAGSGTGHYLLYMGSTSSQSQFFATGVLNLSSVGPTSQGISNAHFLPFEFSGIIGDQAQGVIASFGYEYIVSTDTSGTSGGALAIQPYNKLMTFQGNITSFNSVDWFNVVGYGADSTGTSDSATAIQTALTDAGAVNGVVYFPAGTYLVGTTLQIPNNDVTLIGDGIYETTVKMKNATNLAAIITSFGWGASSAGSSTLPVVIRGITFDGNTSNQSSGAGHCMVLQSSYSYIRDCSFQNGRGDGLRFDYFGANGTSHISNTAVENRVFECQFRNNGGNGLNVSDSSGNTFTDGWVNNCVSQGNTIGITVGASAGWHITGNHIYGSAQDAIQMIRPFMTKVNGNYVEDWGTGATSGSWAAIDLSIANDGGAGSSVIGNVINLNNPAGNAASHLTGISIGAASGDNSTASVVGNVLNASDNTVPANYQAIAIFNQNSASITTAVVSGNTIFGNWGQGLVVLTANGGTLNVNGWYSNSSNQQNISFAPVVLPAGTTTAAPLNFTSGTNMGTAAAGTMEFDGTDYYLTSVASSRQVVDTEQFQYLSSPYTLAATAVAQKIFNATTNGAIVLQGSTSYFFESLLNITGLSSSSHTIDFGLSTSATVSSIMYDAVTATAVGGAASSFIVTSASASAITAANTGTVLQASIRGSIRMTSGGTVTPQITQVTANAAGTVNTNSYFRIWPAGSGTVTSVGNWS